MKTRVLVFCSIALLVGCNVPVESSGTSSIPSPSNPGPSSPTPAAPNTPPLCPATGNGDLDLARICVLDFCFQTGFAGGYGEVLALVERDLGPPDACDPEPGTVTPNPWRICRWGSDYEVRILFDGTDEPNTESDVFDVRWTLRSSDVQTPEGLAAGEPLTCFEQVLGAARPLNDGGVQWAVDKSGDTWLNWYPDRLVFNMGWSE